MNDFLTFKKLITPTILPMVFWIGSIWFIILGGTFIWKGAIVAGVVEIVFGVVIVRILCEALVMLFRIGESLGKTAPAETPPTESPDAH